MRQKLGRGSNNKKKTGKQQQQTSNTAQSSNNSAGTLSAAAAANPNDATASAAAARRQDSSSSSSSSLEAALQFKQQGNQAFQSKDYERAIQCYSSGLGALDDVEEEEEDHGSHLPPRTLNNNSNATSPAGGSKLAMEPKRVGPNNQWNSTGSSSAAVWETWAQLLSNRAMVYLKLSETTPTVAAAAKNNRSITDTINAESASTNAVSAANCAALLAAEADCTTVIQSVGATESSSSSHSTTATTTSAAAGVFSAKVWFRRAMAREKLAQYHHRHHHDEVGTDPSIASSTGNSNKNNEINQYAQLAMNDLRQCMDQMETKNNNKNDTTVDDAEVDDDKEENEIRTKVTQHIQRLENWIRSNLGLGSSFSTPYSSTVPTTTTNQTDLPTSDRHSNVSLLNHPKNSHSIPEPLTPSPPAWQQRADVIRLLSDPQNVPSTDQAFFLVHWEWWCEWCAHVLFFAATTDANKSHRIDEGGDNLSNRIQHIHNSGTEQQRMEVENDLNDEEEILLEDEMGETDEECHRNFLLRLLPRGAVLPDPEDDDDDWDRGGGPGPIDNVDLLLPYPKDASQRSFYKHWYRNFHPPAMTSDTEHSDRHLALRPGLVRGHHYEVLPREVYHALRLWYSELTPSICRRAIEITNEESPTSSLRICLYPISVNNPYPPNSEPCGTCGALGAVMRCRPCMSVYYCDRGCQENAWKAHKAECKILQNNVGNAHYNTRIPTGRTGLHNLGNTCFMNSALQCLSHATPLTRHFLSGQFKADINDSNTLGTGGNLAHSYESVIKALHSHSSLVTSASVAPRSFSPTLLKRSIAQFAPRFAGCLQHDAQEFLAYLLDGLHEDLNRIRNAPYVSMPDVTDGQCIAVAGARAWDAHKRRNDSLVLDTFYGQFKSTCVCPNCQRVSVSFDAFNHVSLEIPQEKNAIVPITVIVFGAAVEGTASAPQPIRYTAPMRLTNCVRDFKSSLSVMCGIPTAQLQLCEYENSTIRSVFDDTRQISDLPADGLLVYEVHPFEGPESDEVFHAVLSHKLVDPVQLDKQHSDPFGYPLITSFDFASTCREIWDQLWCLVCRMVSTDDGFDAKSLVQIRLVNRNEEPRLIFPILDDSIDPEPEATGKMSSLLPPENDESLLSLMGAGPTRNKIIFFQFEWVYTTQEFDGVDERNESMGIDRIDEKRFLIVNNHVSSEAFKNRKENISKKGVTLDQCFETFTKPERLDEHNMWYCSSCKKHVQAMKTMELWKLPNVLIVHLKRFEFKHALRRDKLDTLVDFPMEGLDLNTHCSSVGKSVFVDDRVGAMYDCFAVVNHFGRMGFGHYTAYARSWNEAEISNEWALFDDSSVRSVGDGRGSVVSPAAYVLLYRRRTFF